MQSNGVIGNMFRQKINSITKDALAYVIEELKDYGLEIEVNYLTLEIVIVDVNSKWKG